MVDPISLKLLLKRSNGRSLSEILQQNNLTLSDLLTGKENALSILKKQDLIDNKELNKFKIEAMSEIPELHQKELLEGQHDNAKSNDDIEQKQRPNASNYPHEDLVNIKNDPKTKNVNTQTNSEIENPEIKTNLRRRYPVVRRKLRMRPDTNKTYKGQISRDSVALTSTKYQNNRNTSKYRDRRKLLPFNIKVEKSDSDVVTQDAQEYDTATTTLISLSTIQNLEDSSDAFTENTLETTNADSENNESEMMNTADTTGSVNNTECTSETTTINVETEQVFTEKPKIVLGSRNPFNGSSVRRQAFNNRLKRKRMKQLLSTEEPHDNAMKNIFEMANLVPASEFVAKIKMPTTNVDVQDDYTTLEDFMTTEPTTRITKRKHHRKIPMTTTPKVTITSEVTAKIEIQEILNDTISSERLSRILRERNMTLKELVEQRERGSSHIHLADIFHNTSKEPNPPEPFLSKSLIEPISKETYPLRALLEANQHDPKTTTVDSILVQSNYLNKPIVMDFRNNVNEHSETIGIMSLFDNFTTKTEEPRLQYNETPIGETRVNQILLDEFPINEMPVHESLNNESTQDADKIVTQGKDSRALNSDNSLVTWNEIINFIQQNKLNESDRTTPENGNDKPLQDTFSDIKININPEEDTLRIFEDLKHIKKNSDNNVKASSNEEIEVKIYDSTKSPQLLDFYDTVSSNTKSVTVATAGLIGLSLVLFLLTYSILKWKQQNKIFQNKASKQNEVPSPVFENRKGLKMNSSTRSKSPMLSPSNIYTIDSLDTHKGSDSPEYMWDSLRKPFQ